MNIDHPKLSVVMPTYNAADHIGTALKSICRQTFSDFEVIVIDDGSTDGTRKIIQKFNDDRISIIKRNDKTGITSALNRGIKEARGKFVARHDADDWSAQDRFETQITILEDTPDLSLLGTGAFIVDEQGDKIARRRVLEAPSVTDLLAHNQFIHGSVMMRRKILIDVDGYDERFPTTEDYDLWLRMADRHSVGNIDRPLYYLRQHNNSLYGENLKEVKLYHLLARRRMTGGVSPSLKSDIKDEGIGVFEEVMTKEEKVWLHTELAQELLRYGLLSEGRKHCRKALSYSSTRPSLYGMYLLSFSTSGIAKGIAQLYRKLINLKIAWKNRNSP